MGGTQPVLRARQGGKVRSVESKFLQYGDHGALYRGSDRADMSEEATRPLLTWPSSFGQSPGPPHEEWQAA